jgi:hypothetical protein
VDINGGTYDVLDSPSNYADFGYLYISSSNNVVGNIFYKQGIAVINEHITDPIQGIYIASGSTATVTFNSQVTIYQHRIACKLQGGEFNIPLSNPSIRQNFSDGTKVLDLFASGSITPYITSIGLYDNQNQLISIAKLASPIKRTKYVDQIFIIQFDTIA